MNRMLRTGIPALFTTMAALSASPAIAGGYLSEDGHEYSITCNASGFAMKSRAPVTRFIEDGANSRAVKQRTEVIFFGKSCDAFNKAYGAGTWCQANAGFSATVGGKDILFPRQEPFCDGNYADLGCMCQ